MLGGTKQQYIWTINGTLWSIVDSLAGTTILAEMYGDNFTSTWEIPSSQFASEFIEAKDLRFLADIGLHQPIAAYSTRLLDGAYSGAANEVRRASDNALQDIGFEDSFDYDVPAFEAFIAATTGFQRTWYDQFGAMDNLQANNPDQPQVLATSGTFNRPALLYNGTTQWMANNGLAANFTGNDHEFTTLSVVRRTSAASTGIIWSASRNSTFAPQVSDSFISSNEFRIFRRDDAVNIQTNNVGTTNLTDFFIVGTMFLNNTFYQLFNGALTITPLADIGTLTLDRFTVGAFTKGSQLSFWKGDIDELLLWNVPIGVEQFVLTSYNMNQFYAIY